MEFSHIPVLFHEALDALNIQPERVYVDCTAGGGGHAAAIAEKLGARILHVLWKDEDSVNACACDDGQTCRSGLLNAATLKEHADLEHAEVYLCGPPEMHRMTMEILRSLGTDPARIHTEVMSPAPPPKAPATKPSGA